MWSFVIVRSTGVVATVASGVTLKLQDKLTVNGSGTLTFEDVQVLYKLIMLLMWVYQLQGLRPQYDTDYTYWSSLC
jgi:hypothetical protein